MSLIKPEQVLVQVDGNRKREGERKGRMGFMGWPIITSEITRVVAGSNSFQCLISCVARGSGARGPGILTAPPDKSLTFFSLRQKKFVLIPLYF